MTLRNQSYFENKFLMCFFDLVKTFVKHGTLCQVSYNYNLQESHFILYLINWKNYRKISGTLIIIELFLTCVILDDQTHALVVFLALQTLLIVEQNSDSQMMIPSRWFGHASLDLSVLTSKPRIANEFLLLCLKLTCGHCRTTCIGPNLALLSRADEEIGWESQLAISFITLVYLGDKFSKSAQGYF